MNIVCTGNTRGIGLALTREFLSRGDNVIVSSRDEGKVTEVVKTLQKIYLNSQVPGIACDVRHADQVAKLGSFAIKELKTVDIWINNAGIRGSLSSLHETPVEQYSNVIQTNVIGVLNGCKTALIIMIPQRNRGNIFNMAGMGSFGRATPRMVAYGASKASIPLLTKSLVKETKGIRVGIHVLSPGMVITDFTGKDIGSEAARIFNILADLPDTVAKVLVPQIRRIKGTGKTINYLTRSKAIIRFLTAWRRKNRFFDEEGHRLN